VSFGASQSVISKSHIYPLTPLTGVLDGDVRRSRRGHTRHATAREGQRRDETQIFIIHWMTIPRSLHLSHIYIHGGTHRTFKSRAVAAAQLGLPGRHAIAKLCGRGGGRLRASVLCVTAEGVCGWGAAPEHASVLGYIRAECNAGGGSWAALDQAEGQAAGRGAEYARGAQVGEKAGVALQLRLRALIIAAAAAVAGEE
jgi:hypothetical protein